MMRFQPPLDRSNFRGARARRLRARLLPLAILLLTLASGSVRAQISVSDVHGIVGEEVRLPVRYLGTIDSLEPVTIAGSFLLGNPTVFFPERFTAAGSDSVVASELRRLTDSTYTFSVTILPRSAGRPGLDTIFHLAGEALAGFDSVTTVSFRDLRVDDVSAPPALGTITTTSIGTPLPYVRYATLEKNYPNPVIRGSSTTWTYRIDKQSLVRFIIYNPAGEEVIVMEEGVKPAGVHLITLVPGYDVAMGVYWARLNTNTGDAFQPMHVIR